MRWRLALEEEEEGEEPVTEKRNEREDDVGKHGGGRAQLSPHFLLPTPSPFPDPYPSLAHGTAVVCFDGGSVEPGGGDDDGERKTKTRSGSSGAGGPGHGRRKRRKIQSGWDLGVGERAGGVTHLLHGSSAQTDNPA